nr:FGGY-family carbohydrate kinase [Candidatus Neomarinimicrobiota bacterium]
LISSILTSSNTNRMFMVEGTINACNSLFYHLEKELNIPHEQMHWHRRCQERKTNGVFIPGFTGLAAPYWASGFPDIYEGIDTSDPNDMIRAGMESIGFLTYDILEQMKPIATSWPKKLTASGGGARSPLLQFIADLTGLPVCHSTMKDRTAYGVYQLIRPKEKNLSKFEESYFNLTFHPSMMKDQQKSKVNCWHKALENAGLIK